MSAFLIGAANVIAKNPILPDAKEIIWTVIAFAFVFVILAKFAFPAMKKGLKDREDRIRADLERADHPPTEAEATLEQYRPQPPQPHTQANPTPQQAHPSP